MKKRILSLLMTLSLTLIPCVSAYAEAESVPAAITEERSSDDLMFTDSAKTEKAAATNGNCGDQDSNVKWSLSNGVLTISGKGKIADLAFHHMNIQKVIIKSGVTSIGVGAFRGCDLTSVTIPSSVASIEDAAFYLCTDLTEVTIPSGVKTIEDQAFAYCSGIKSVTIPSSVTSIGRFAFRQCTSLKSITVKNSTCKIPESLFFDSCVTLGVPGVTTVYGYKGSTAEAFAKKWKYSFKSIGTSTLATPKISKVKNTSKGIKITWGKVNGAEKYRVFYKTGNKGWMKLADTKAASYTWKKAKKGKKYTFTVRCISADGKEYTSSFDNTGKSIVYSAGA